MLCFLNSQLWRKRFKTTHSSLELFRENKGDFLRASYIHYFDHERKVAAVAVIGRTLSRKENSFFVGGSWSVDDLTTIKARFDSRGKLVTVLRHKIKPKSYFTISGEFEPKALDKTPEIRLGLSLVLWKVCPFFSWVIQDSDPSLIGALQERRWRFAAFVSWKCFNGSSSSFVLEMNVESAVLEKQRSRV